MLFSLRQMRVAGCFSWISEPVASAMNYERGMNWCTVPLQWYCTLEIGTLETPLFEWRPDGEHLPILLYFFFPKWSRRKICVGSANTAILLHPIPAGFPFNTLAGTIFSGSPARTRVLDVCHNGIVYWDREVSGLRTNVSWSEWRIYTQETRYLIMKPNSTMICSFQTISYSGFPQAIEEMHRKPSWLFPTTASETEVLNPTYDTCAVLGWFPVMARYAW